MRFPGTLIALALGACLCGAAAAQQKQKNFYPVARIATPEGYMITAVQTARAKDACEQANKRFAEALMGKCTGCRVESNQCKTRLRGDERAVVNRTAIKKYVVAAGPTRIIVSGSRKTVRSACEQIAAGTAMPGGGKAVCVKPGATAK